MLDRVRSGLNGQVLLTTQAATQEDLSPALRALALQVAVSALALAKVRTVGA